VEPFYNGQARVEGFDGSLSVISESGDTLVELRGPLRSPLEEFSADMVGLWKTQTIRASVELGLFEALPADPGELERRLELGKSVAPRLLRALTELGLVVRDRDGVYHLTDKGAYLRRSHPLSLVDATRHWGREAWAAWSEASWSLRTGESGFRKRYGKDFFDWLEGRPEELESYHRAMAAYARHDYLSLPASVDFGIHDSILDAGGGAGELAFALLRAFPNLTAMVMDRPEVVAMAVPPPDLEVRCDFVEGDFFGKWPVRSEAVVLARVLHDWPDDDARRVLRRAREAMPGGGILYLVEMVLDDSTGSGALLDLHMLVATGGAERTEAHFRALLDASGFELLDVAPTGSVSSVIRARAV
jgi:DNA-binding transcriptional ArsR family regulator